MAATRTGSALPRVRGGRSGNRVRPARIPGSLALLPTAGLIDGCNSIDPAAIQGGRLAYNEAIAESTAAGTTTPVLTVPVSR